LIKLIGRKSKHSEKWFSWEGGMNLCEEKQKGSLRAGEQGKTLLTGRCPSF